MKILRIINSLGFGGAESQLVGLVPQLIDAGNEVVVVALLNKENLLGKLDKRVKYYNLRITNITSAIKGLRALLKIVAAEKPQLIHSDLLQANLLARLVKLRYPKIKVINTTHCNYNLSTRNYNPYSLYRFTSKWVDLQTAVSKPALSALIENKSINEKKSKLVLNAIDTSGFAAQPQFQKPFRWIAVGRLIKDKDYSNLLSAARLLIDKNEDFSIDIYGEGTEQTQLEVYRESFDSNRQVNFLGVSANIPGKLSQYQGFVISSQNEALPMALLEAMCAGLPVVATNVGEMKAIISASGGGIIVEKQDSQALANAMSQVMNFGIKELEVMGAANSQFVKQTFSSAIIAKQWLHIYKEIVEPGDKV